MGGRRKEANKHCQIDNLFADTSTGAWCMVHGLSGALCILRGALSLVSWVLEEEEANKQCQIDYPSGDIESELHEQLQMSMPTFLEFSSMTIDYTKYCN